MSYDVNDMSSYDDTGKVQKSAYVLEPGNYNIYVGNSIKDAGEKGVRYTYKANDLSVSEQLTQEQAPTQLDKRLLADGTYETLTPATSSATTQEVSTAPTQTVQPTQSKLMLKDVYENPSLMDQFLAQLSDAQLADLSQGKKAQIAGGTGGIGGLADYGIPSAQTSDGPAGLRLTSHTTAWPVETLLACTWDVDLVKQMGEAVGKEAQLNNVDLWLAPAMNIHRNPLNGRNFEYFSEDPLITGKMAAAITSGVQSEGIGVTIKHFAANNKEVNRNSSDSRMSERALREIYLKGFENAVKEAQPWAVMSSYNLINGKETSESKDLLTNILRGEWGYKGMVMTDWGNNSTHYKEAKAGNDVKMPSGNTANLLSALASGDLTRQDLERNIKNVLNMVMKTQVFKKRVLHPTVTKIRQKETTRVKAMDFSWSSNGIGTQASLDTDGGVNPTNTNQGEWLSYNINVQRSGDYNFTPRVAVNTAGASFDLYVDNNKVGTVVQNQATGGLQNWVTGAPVQIHLPEGQHTLKLQITASGMNINWFELSFLQGETE